jgi:hypothetical protein
MRAFLRLRFALSVKIQHVIKEAGAIDSESFRELTSIAWAVQVNRLYLRLLIPQVIT